MKLIQKTIQLQPSLTLPWDEMLLMPISDVQYGAVGCDFDKFQRHMDWGLEHGAYFVGLGDYLDVASPTGRRKLLNADLHDSEINALEEIAALHLARFYEAVKLSRGRWLGLVHGHHYFDFKDGTTTDTRLAELLACEFLGDAAIVQLDFPGHAISCQIWLHHGTGSGETMASPLNKLEKQMVGWPTVDIFLMGHYSRKISASLDGLVPVFGELPRLVAKRRILACTGGFVRGYSLDTVSYVERDMLRPTNLGGLVIYIRPVRTEYGGRLDLNCSV